MTIVKADFIKVVSERLELKEYESVKFVEDFFGVIIQALESGEEVTIPKLGKFILRDKKSRTGRNPRTREEFPIETRRVVSFRTSNMLKLAIYDYDQRITK